jgi:hypothetical protein
VPDGNTAAERHVKYVIVSIRCRILPSPIFPISDDGTLFAYFHADPITDFITLQFAGAVLKLISDELSNAISAVDYMSCDIKK